MLLDKFLRNTAERLPSKAALVTHGARYSYGEIERMARSLAGTLQAHGIKRGDRVAIFAPNGAEVVVGIYAALFAGAVFMPINPQTKADKLRYILQDARASALITHASLASTWQSALAGARSVHTVVVTGGDGPDTALGGARVQLSFAAAVERSARALTDPCVIDVDLAAIIYTSGSTGEPKGVMLTHANMRSAAASIVTYLGLQESDIIMCALPLAFDYGLYQVLMAFQVGATVLLEASFAFPTHVLEVMQRERATFLPGVPTMFATLMQLKTLANYDLRPLRAITNTAAALSQTQIEGLRQLFPHATLFSMYGLTECKRVSYLPPEELDRRPTSVGRGMPNVEVYLVDDSGQPLPPGNVGELVVRGSNVMRGYWEKPKETAERLRPGRYPGEMVLYTGDVFRTDGEGFLYFVGRKDDIIKSRGEKVSPREVENAIFTYPGVSDVAVIGVDDPIAGQAIKAFVVLSAGVAATEREIIKHCLARLENFMVPKYVEFVTTLPVTNTGKVSKAQLRQAAQAAAGVALHGAGGGDAAEGATAAHDGGTQ